MNNYLFDKTQHLHTYDGKPLTGTSTVMEVLSKPLTWWASGCAVGVLGWCKPIDWKKLKTDEDKKRDFERRLEVAKPAFEMIKGLSCEDYLELLDKAYKAHSVKLDKSAEEGTDLHETLEHFVKNHMKGQEVIRSERILPFVEWTKKNVKRFLGSEVHCFSAELWTGGVTDVVAELNDDTIAIIDFKSAKDAYASHFFQIGGYDLQISENGCYDFQGNLLFKLDKPITKHIVVPFGAKEPYPIVSELVAENREAFKSALSLYRIINKLNNQ